MEIFVQRNGVKDGPFTLKQIKLDVHKGRISFSDLVWISGQPDWRLLQDVPELVNEIIPPVAPAENTQSPNKNTSNTKLIVGWIGIIGIVVFVYTLPTPTRYDHTTREIESQPWKKWTPAVLVLTGIARWMNGD